MYADVEVAENVDEDFLSALALLHSSDVGSAEKLRKMLDLSIERKIGGTYARGEPRLPERKHDGFLPFDYRSTEATGIVSEFEDQLKLMEESTSPDDYQDGNAGILTRVHDFPIVDRDSRSSGELCATEFEDPREDEEIPRISIPDETTDDGAVCKICRGDRLGPLILLECQECQEAYHPLCHRPPVVDIDVYDPRLVWRCGKCIETSDAGTVGASFVVNFDEDGIDASEDGSRKIGVAVSRTSKFGGRQEGATKIGCFGRTRCRGDDDEKSPRKTFRSSQKNGTNPRASSHLRKRVGSKLSVTRTSSAN